MRLTYWDMWGIVLKVCFRLPPDVMNILKGEKTSEPLLQRQMARRIAGRGNHAHWDRLEVINGGDKMIWSSSPETPVGHGVGVNVVGVYGGPTWLSPAIVTNLFLMGAFCAAFANEHTSTSALIVKHTLPHRNKHAHRHVHTRVTMHTYNRVHTHRRHAHWNAHRHHTVTCTNTQATNTHAYLPIQ